MKVSKVANGELQGWWQNSLEDILLIAAVIGVAAVLLTKNPVTQASSLILDPLQQLENSLGVGKGTPGTGVDVNHLLFPNGALPYINVGQVHAL
jgi:hypothetical protein